VVCFTTGVKGQSVGSDQRQYISSWNCQMLSTDQLLSGKAAWVALPSAHHGKNQTYWATILQPAEMVRTPVKVTTLAFCLICLYPPPPIQVYCSQPPLRHTKHMTYKSKYSKGRSFLPSSYLGPAPLATTAESHNGSPFHSHRAGTCLPLLANKGNRGGPNHTTAKQMRFSISFIVLCIHAISVIEYF
jgi:hypothetical protein